MIGSFLTVGEQVLILFALMAVGFALGKAKLIMYEVLRSRSDGARLTGRESVQLEKPRGE